MRNFVSGFVFLSIKLWFRRSCCLTDEFDLLCLGRLLAAGLLPLLEGGLDGGRHPGHLRGEARYKSAIWKVVRWLGVV